MIQSTVQLKGFNTCLPNSVSTLIYFALAISPVNVAAQKRVSGGRRSVSGPDSGAFGTCDEGGYGQRWAVRGADTAQLVYDCVDQNM